MARDARVSETERHTGTLRAQAYGLSPLVSMYLVLRSSERQYRAVPSGKMISQRGSFLVVYRWMQCSMAALSNSHRRATKAYPSMRIAHPIPGT